MKEIKLTNNINIHEINLNTNANGNFKMTIKDNKTISVTDLRAWI